MTEESQQTGLYELCVECFSQARRMTESSAEVCDPPHLPIWARTNDVFWPAKIIGTGGIARKEIYVRFFGNHSRGKVTQTDCLLFTERSPNKDFQGTDRGKYEQFKAAMEAAHNYMMNLKERYSCDLFLVRRKCEFNSCKIGEYLMNMIPGLKLKLKSTSGIIPERQDKLTQKQSNIAAVEAVQQNYNVNENSDKISINRHKRKHSDIFKSIENSTKKRSIQSTSKTTLESQRKLSDKLTRDFTAVGTVQEIRNANLRAQARNDGNDNGDKISINRQKKSDILEAIEISTERNIETKSKIIPESQRNNPIPSHNSLTAVEIEQQTSNDKVAAKNQFNCTHEFGFHCSKCLRGFDLKEAMKRHESYCKRFKCNLCNYRTLYKWSLVNHMSIHNRKKPFKCAKCGKTFPYAINLKNHMRIHEYEFHCSFCFQGFDLEEAKNLHEQLCDCKRF